MRLLNISTLELCEFGENATPPYAIASHRWTTDESTYKDVKKRRNTQSIGYQKIQDFCSFMKKTNVETTRAMSALGIQRDCQWLWIDTACIDKKSSTELTESINSMLHYYASAEICYAYLQDVGPTGGLEFMQSEWFRRGWTLQELLAPRTVAFLARNWEIIGHKCRLQACDVSCRGLGICLNSRVSNIAGISKDYLSFDWTSDRTLNLPPPTIELVTCWASMRSTERVEDNAYCLLGLLGINLVPIYGERDNAWTRLRKEYRDKQMRWKENPPNVLKLQYESMQTAPLFTSSTACSEPIVAIPRQRILHMSEGPPETRGVVDPADSPSILWTAESPLRSLSPSRLSAIAEVKMEDPKESESSFQRMIQKEARSVINIENCSRHEFQEDVAYTPSLHSPVHQVLFNSQTPYIHENNSPGAQSPPDRIGSLQTHQSLSDEILPSDSFSTRAAGSPTFLEPSNPPPQFHSFRETKSPTVPITHRHIDSIQRTKRTFTVRSPKASSGFSADLLLAVLRRVPRTKDEMRSWAALRFLSNAEARMQISRVSCFQASSIYPAEEIPTPCSTNSLRRKDKSLKMERVIGLIEALWKSIEVMNQRLDALGSTVASNQSRLDGLQSYPSMRVVDFATQDRPDLGG